MFNITLLYLPLFFCLSAQVFTNSRGMGGNQTNPSNIAGQWIQNNRSRLAVVDTSVQSQHNTLTEQEKAEGWALLFDGQDPNSQWRSVRGNDFPKQGWAIDEGSLVLLPGNRGGDIITRQPFTNFELVLDYKLTDSANTGIKYFVSEIRDLKGKTSLNGLEFQLIDDFKHETIVGGKSPETSTGSLYLLYAPKNKQLKPAGEWNQARIIAKGNTVEHWLNGVKVVSYQRGTEEFRKLVSHTKFKEYIDYGEAVTGYILLQDHHDMAFFRNIKIRRIE